VLMVASQHDAYYDLNSNISFFMHAYGCLYLCF
jgi:hypothetical protein